jgi:hypothetical protein
MPGYFKNFPTIHYKSENVDTVLCNILVKGNLRDISKKAILQTLAIQEGDRADYIAHLLFNDSSYDYLFYILNDIIDPYYEWYLTAKQLDEYIKDKYEFPDDVKHYKLDIVENYVESIEVTQAGSGYSNTDYVIISGGTKDARGNITTNVSGGITNIKMKRKGADISVPEIVIYNSGGDISNGTNCRLIPVITNTRSPSNTVLINTDTYDQLSEARQLLYIPVTHAEYEYEENEKRRFLNAVLPNVGYQIDGEIKSMLRGLDVNLK